MASPTKAQSRANVTIGIIGAGIRGLELMGVALEAGAKVAMVCDLYDGHFRRAQELQKNTPTTRDFHEVLALPDVQAVLVATSDHWHAPVAIAAMRAGKDVYCEKPMAHTIAQALEMAALSRETGGWYRWAARALAWRPRKKPKHGTTRALLERCSWRNAPSMGRTRLARGGIPCHRMLRPRRLIGSVT
jgi:hypothetical protein